MNGLSMFILLAAGLGASIASAQATAHQHDASTVQLKVVVDGAKNPELIPDELAMRHFLLSIAEPRNASPTATDRRASHLRPIGLAGADTAALIHAMDGVREELDGIQAERDALEKDSSVADADRAVALDRLNIAEHAATDTAATRVSAFLSASGRQQLQAYLGSYVKAHIQILGN
jgi:hypothetical protein